MSKGRPPTIRTPQEKKRLSLAKDRRNAYGNSDKAARKAIPLRKAIESRRDRRRAAQDLSIMSNVDEARADALESSVRNDVYRKGGWTKGADMPLGEWIDRCERAIGQRAFTRVRRGTDDPG